MKKRQNKQKIRKEIGNEKKKIRGKNEGNAKKKQRKRKKKIGRENILRKK